MYKKKNVLAVIPARSESKGIKNKNIKILNGKPLIYYTIKYAKKCNFIDHIIVSTDSTKYAAISKKFGAEIPFIRNKKLAKDNVKDYPVMYDALKKSEEIYKKKFDLVILLRPTSPFRENNLIEKSLKLLTKNKLATSVRAVQVSSSHPYRHWVYEKNKKFITGFVNKINEPYNLVRQMLPKLFFQTGDIELIKRSTLIKGSVSGNKVLPIFMKKKIIDIDTLDDFKKIKKNTNC